MFIKINFEKQVMKNIYQVTSKNVFDNIRRRSKEEILIVCKNRTEPDRLS